jgi:hypothetical protein
MSSITFFFQLNSDFCLLCDSRKKQKNIYIGTILVKLDHGRKSNGIENDAIF